MTATVTCAPIDKVWDGVNGADLTLGVIGALGILSVGITLAVESFTAAGVTPATIQVAGVALIAACLMTISLVHKIRDYAFHYKLACLDGTRCAIAQVVSIEADADGDTALNTVLAPATNTTEVAEYQAMYQGGSLVYMDPGLATRGWHLKPTDNGVHPGTFGKGLPLFHCEIVGSYLDDWTTAFIAYLWSLVALAAAAVALATVADAAGPFGWAIWIAIAFLLLLAGWFARKGQSDESEAGASPVGSATPGSDGPVITDSGGTAIRQGDYIALIGLHACDTGHHGKKDDPTDRGCWDELHPVMGITKISSEQYAAAPTMHTDGDIYDRYCQALQDWVNRTGDVQNAPLEHRSLG